MSLLEALHARLARRHADGLHRQRRIAEGPAGVERVIDGEALLTFCSNDYLGLADHPAVARAFHLGIERWGAGSGAAHLIDGHTRAHHALEEELADWTGQPRALLFSTGYMANIGVLTALAGEACILFEDRLNHASLLDGALLSRRRLVRYDHADPDDLARRLTQSTQPLRLVATDGVFSMDGDIAPLPTLAQICQTHGAGLIVDDAHALGVIGREGAGSLAACGVASDPLIAQVGTLGKALGTFGAFVAGHETLIETVLQFARSYLFTTAPPAALAEATRAAVRLARAEGWRRDHLANLITRFRRGAESLGLELLPSTTPIQPLVLGSAERAVQCADQLRRAGLLVPALRPPTVPDGSARLRITFSARHSEAHVDRLLEALAEVVP